MLEKESFLNLLEEILSKGCDIRMRVTGRSMTPFLLGGELVTIRRVPASSVRIGDIIFFKTCTGHPVVHRVVRKNQAIFQTKGDALQAMDEPVSQSRLLGKVCLIEKHDAAGSKTIRMDSTGWYAANRMVVTAHYVKSSLRAVLRRIKGALLRPAAAGRENLR